MNEFDHSGSFVYSSYFTLDVYIAISVLAANETDYAHYS